MAGTASGNVTVILGDLLSSDTHIAHCISADLKMSRGVALEIRNQFGGLELLKSQNLGVGSIGRVYLEYCTVHNELTVARIFTLGRPG